MVNRRYYLTQEELRERVARDVELEHAYWRLLKRYGRPPTTRELWAESPPPERVLGPAGDYIYVEVHDE
jgi:hypothetical protein